LAQTTHWQDCRLYGCCVDCGRLCIRSRPVTAFFADALDAWSQLEALIWPILGAVLIAMFVMRKTKQGANKA
jgi:hypothetical protein